MARTDWIIFRKGYEETIVSDDRGDRRRSCNHGRARRNGCLRHMGAQRIAIASCYPPGHNEALKNYLASFGFEVVRAEGTNMPKADSQDAKALFAVAPMPRYLQG